MKKIITLMLLLGIIPANLYAQEKAVLSLEDCFRIAKSNNLSIQQSQQSIITAEEKVKARKSAYLPKVDVLGTYQYLGEPLEIGLQDFRDDVVDGISNQSVSSSNHVYHEITGNDLPQSAQDAIYNSSSNIIDGVYPEDNLRLSNQSYFTVGAAMRMPIYLGGKRVAAQSVAERRLETSTLSASMIGEAISFAIVTEYFKILYQNSMIETQDSILQAYQTTEKNAKKLVENEIIPPYQKHWASVALAQAQTSYDNLILKQENSYEILKELIGVDTTFVIDGKLKRLNYIGSMDVDEGWKNHPQYQFLEGETKLAEAMVKTNTSRNLPNVFAVANYQFLKKDLPVVTPPWMVGVTFQWNIFSFFENSKHTKAAKSRVKERELGMQKHENVLRTQSKIAHNRIIRFGNEMETLDAARKEAKTAVDMVEKRLNSQLASVKDMNDALKIQYTAEKAYHTSVLAYNMAVANYLKQTGTIQEITQIINR